MTESKYQGVRRPAESASVQAQEEPPREGQPNVPHGTENARSPDRKGVSPEVVEQAKKSPER